MGLGGGGGGEVVSLFTHTTFLLKATGVLLLLHMYTTFPLKATGVWEVLYFTHTTFFFMKVMRVVFACLLLCWGGGGDNFCCIYNLSLKATGLWCVFFLILFLHIWFSQQKHSFTIFSLVHLFCEHGLKDHYYKKHTPSYVINFLHYNTKLPWNTYSDPYDYSHF